MILHYLTWWQRLRICIPAKYRGTRAISAGKVAQLPPAMSETTEPTPASVRCPQSVRQRPVTCRGSDSETWRWSLARRRSSKHHPLSQSWHNPDTILTSSWHHPDIPPCRRYPPAPASISTSPYLCPRWSGAPVSTSPGDILNHCHIYLLNLLWHISTKW